MAHIKLILLNGYYSHPVDWFVSFALGNVIGFPLEFIMRYYENLALNWNYRKFRSLNNFVKFTLQQHKLILVTLRFVYMYVYCLFNSIELISHVAFHVQF